jgi:TPR repeat protein
MMTMPTRIILVLMLSLLVLPAFAQGYIDQWRLRAEQGDAEAQYWMGMVHDGRPGQEGVNVKEAIRWYRLAADQGHANAQLILGLKYRVGRDVPQDEKEAVRWYRLAADQGDAMAQAVLGLMYAEGRGVRKNEKEAVRWYRLAADQGDADAQYTLGVRYATGRGVPQDDKEAVRWYRLAADQGYANAQHALGFSYGDGRGVPQDDKEAVRWWRLAADQGHADAQNNLGLMYANGRGVPQDYNEAVRWFRLAADQGHASAQYYNLGVMYGAGRSVPQNDQEAVRWYRLAADQGDARAQYNLGLRYGAGRGVLQDHILAHMWHNLAASNGADRAVEQRDQLAAMMSPRDLSEAQRLAREWKPGSIDYAEGREPKAEPFDHDKDWKGNGSGIVLSTNGIIATNYHVIEGATDIAVELMRDGIRMSYSAKVRNFDERNDLALIQIVDPDYQPFKSLRYKFETSLADVGTSVFTLGFPLVALMGEEMKFTEGTISSRTGFQGAITEYQVSVPVQPGNSGGPLFDDEGNLVALINAKITAAENVTYAIKTNYLKSLVDVLGVPIQLPQDSSLSGIPLTEQIKILSEYVAIILVR